MALTLPVFRIITMSTIDKSTVMAMISLVLKMT